ncbi:MAG TPA: DUF1800 family protein [Xanthobacteraceae bacterium]|nr:DUF1800 family protein [Xanthobacteraceae bacterium]
MSTGPRYQAALALHRFGLGPKSGTLPGSIAAVASDPRGALLAELARPGAGLIVDGTLMTAAQAGMAAFNFREEQRAREIARQGAEKAHAESAGSTVKPAAPAEPAKPAKPAAETSTAAAKPSEPTVVQRIIGAEARARFAAARTAEIGFVERLVWFWSNHLCVSSLGAAVMAGGYEREAIRPHVLGRFADMLVASASHPAMLQYLDNARSIGPTSVAGLIVKVGLNENYARELLELHTLGVRTGYTQEDVTNLAKILTGWTFIGPVVPGHGLEFVFSPRLHEPGAQVVLGKTYAEVGINQGRAALADLARHPVTARHVATKLARHFVADDPPPALIGRLARRFLDTDGDLKEIAKALVEAPETWETPPTKLKRPNEWLTAMRRALPDAPGNVKRGLQVRLNMGEPLWGVPAPEGFPDVQASWADGLAQRLDIAARTGERLADSVDAMDLVETTLGPLASADTKRAVARADSRAQAITIALMAPEFHRR